MNEQREETGLKRDAWIESRPLGRPVHTSHQPNADKFCYHSSLTHTSAGKKNSHRDIRLNSGRPFTQTTSSEETKPAHEQPFWERLNEQWKLTKHYQLHLSETSKTYRWCRQNQDTANIP